LVTTQNGDGTFYNPVRHVLYTSLKGDRHCSRPYTGKCIAYGLLFFVEETYHTKLKHTVSGFKKNKTCIFKFQKIKHAVSGFKKIKHTVSGFKK